MLSRYLFVAFLCLLGPVVVSAQTTQRVAVLVLTFQDLPAPTEPISVIKAGAFGPTNSLKSYWEEVSYHQLQVTGDVFGYLAVPFTSTCPAADPLFYTWTSAAQAIAARMGYVAVNY